MDEMKEMTENTETVTGKEEDSSIWKKEEKEGTEGTEKTDKKKPFANKPKSLKNGFLTIDPNDNIEILDWKRAAWNKIKAAHKKGKVLHGILSEVAKTEAGTGIAATFYEGVRVVIPLSQMGLEPLLSKDEKFKSIPNEVRLIMLATTMIGAEISFVIKGYDEKEGLVFASRRDALIENIKTYYATLDEEGVPIVYYKPYGEARIIAVSKDNVNNKNITVEYYGIQTVMNANKLSWSNIESVEDLFHVGEKLLVKLEDVEYPDVFDGCEKNEDWLTSIKIDLDHKVTTPNKAEINFPNIKLKTTYRAVVTGIDKEKGIYHLDLPDYGVKGRCLASSCRAQRAILKGDTVNFICEKKYEDTFVVEGIISRASRCKY